MNKNKEEIIFKFINGCWRNPNHQSILFAEILANENILFDDNAVFCRYKFEKYQIEIRAYGGTIKFTKTNY